MTSVRTVFGTTAILLALAACGQQEEEVVIQPTPIYAKDGTIVSYDSTVVNDTDLDGDIDSDDIED